MTQPTTEELSLIRNHILLPILLSVFEKKMPTNENVISQIQNDITSVRINLRQRNIKVWEVSKSPSELGYAYLCHGYQGAIRLMREVVKSELSTMMKKYTN